MPWFLFVPGTLISSKKGPFLHHPLDPQAYPPAPHPALTIPPSISLCSFQPLDTIFLRQTFPSSFSWGSTGPQDRDPARARFSSPLLLSGWRKSFLTLLLLLLLYNLFVMAKHVSRPLPPHRSLSLLQTLRNNASILLFSHKFLSLW